MPPRSSPSNFASAFSALQRDLACPACHGALQLAPEHVICSKCGRRYPVVDGIPVLIREAASLAD